MNKTLWHASKVFAPDFPRNAADDGTMQARRASRGEFVAALERASGNEMPGYYSVYSFPRGHPKNGHIPKVDCIFIDLDVVGHHYQPNPNKPGYDTTFASWRASMSALLARARMIAQAIIEEDRAQHFRVTLSGHKGVHLYLDFPALSPDNGSLRQFKNGLKLYGQQLMDGLDEMCGGVNIGPWVDVDGSDLARLSRHPNTRHHGAVYDDVDRWCVAVTVEELATLTVDDYLDLTAQPRPLPEGYQRVPSEAAAKRVQQRIRTAADSASSGRGSRRTKTKRSALRDYKNEVQNDEITLEDVLFLTGDKPCISRFRQRADAYEHGDSSRAMELSIMGRFIEMNVPVDTMHEFFEPIPGYDEDFTEDLLADLLARNNEYGEFRCVTICGGHDENGQQVPGQAPQFCLGEACAIHRRSPDLAPPR